MTTRLIIASLILINFMSLGSISEELPAGSASDMGRLTLGQSWSDAIRVLHQTPPSRDSEATWLLEIPRWGLERLKFSQGRISELSGTHLNLGGSQESIKRGDLINEVRQNLPPASRVLGTSEDGIIEWELDNQVFLLEMDYGRAKRWQRGGQLLSLTIKGGAVDKIVLSGEP